MSATTAKHRLERMILFQLIQQTQRDKCYVCDYRIEEVDQLSIEHKLPWYGDDRDSNLYWNLDNIAFSHRKCNLPHRRGNGGIKQRIVSPEGMSWCSSCKAHKTIDCFTKNKSTWKGIHPQCKICQKADKNKVRHGE